MKSIKLLVSDYKSVYAAAKAFSINAQQLHRYIQYNCLVDDEGTIYKPQGAIKVPVSD